MKMEEEKYGQAQGLDGEILTLTIKNKIFTTTYFGTKYKIFKDYIKATPSFCMCKWTQF